MKSLEVVAFIFTTSLSMLVGCGSDSGAATKKSYVLVHSAWEGAWCWNDVVTGLRAKGETVATVELPAHGADQTPLADATLDAYVAKVRAAIDAAPQPVTLVGHSMGGVVVTDVAELSGATLAKVIYLGAYLNSRGSPSYRPTRSPTCSLPMVRQARPRSLPRTTATSRWLPS